MKEFLLPSFNRRYVLIPMLAAIALVVVSYLITEERRSYVVTLNALIHDRQERLREVAELIYANADAESAQRGYLLTADEDYLEPYSRAKTRIDSSMSKLMEQYKTRDNTELVSLGRAEKLIEDKFSEMNATLTLAMHGNDNESAIRLIKTDIGLVWMSQLRRELEGIRNRERERVYADLELTKNQIRVNGYISGVGSLLSIILLLSMGALVTRDIERRNSAAHALDNLVNERTRELTELSQHMLNVSEREKSKLARELHDELGGLLVAMKMDLVFIGKKFDFSQPEIQVRWQRIQSALAAGVALKRRVIEELRPTLLDNMGLIAALRWQAEETCSQAGITLETQLDDEEPQIDPATAIALFRVAQEAFINIAKHSRATVAKIALEIGDQDLSMTIEDNGIGLPANRSGASGSHGLLSMKHRMQAVGGKFHIEALEPKGTRLALYAPFHKPVPAA